MTYQDVWINGRRRAVGYRECEKRYAIIRAWCVNNLPARFTVCDVGANLCYFGIRLVEEFAATVIALESNPAVLKRAREVTKRLPGLVLLGHRATPASLGTLATVARVDLVLGMSVLHHVPPIDQATLLQAMRRLGRHVIVELAGTDSKRVTDPHPIPYGSQLLGAGESHLEHRVHRPIVWIAGETA